MAFRIENCPIAAPGGVTVSVPALVKVVAVRADNSGTIVMLDFINEENGEWIMRTQLEVGPQDFSAGADNAKAQAYQSIKTIAAQRPQDAAFGVFAGALDA